MSRVFQQLSEWGMPDRIQFLSGMALKRVVHVRKSAHEPEYRPLVGLRSTNTPTPQYSSTPIPQYLHHNPLGRGQLAVFPPPRRIDPQDSEMGALPPARPGPP